MIRVPRRTLYERVISPSMRAHIVQNTTRVGALHVARIAPHDAADDDAAAASMENGDVLAFAATLFERVRPSLARVLARRESDRAAIDAAMRDARLFNRLLALERDVAHPLYRTAVGAVDASSGRVLFGAARAGAPFNVAAEGGQRVAALPAHLRGAHVTLFGPADSARMAANAMNAMHRKLPDEPAELESRFLRRCAPPRWGADNEDSKTPLRLSLFSSMHNLAQCYDGSLAGLLADSADGTARRSTPFKRIPGLALPSVAHVHAASAEPLPLHVLDLALHMHYMWQRPEALTFYFPKLETDEEAAYLAELFRTAEQLVQERRGAAQYALGTVRVLIVLENPRALFRINEIIDALHPYFAGASLGWHDYLASTARLFKEDPAYRIPAKSDPNIVLRHIKESHVLLAKVVSARGGIAIGGMYGVLPFGRDLRDASMIETLVGYIKDVVTQLRRGLDGFWVAHPDFVRIGIALVGAHRGDDAGADEAARVARLQRLATLLVPSRAAELCAFIAAPDPTPSLDRDDPAYARAVLAAELGEAAGLANSTDAEMRYNVVQMLQYLAAWLSGTGCVALPATVRGTRVRVMDDLATIERSRWQVWLELYHGRFPLEQFLGIVDDAARVIREGQDEHIHVRWDAASDKWYRVARRLLVRLTTDREPVEFATELLMAFTIDSVRAAADPWAAVVALDAHKFRFSPYVERFDAGGAAAARAMPLAELGRLDELLQRAGGGGGAVHGVSVATLWPLGAGADEVSMVGHSSSSSDSGSGRVDIGIGSVVAGRGVASADTLLQHASLSKPIATAFALEFFRERGLSLEAAVNDVLAQTRSPYRVESAGDAAWAAQLQLQHLVSHTGALGQHYVHGHAVDGRTPLPEPLALLRGEVAGYERVRVRRAPDTEFAYSGAGFVLLQHVIEALAGGEQHISALMAPWLARCGLDHGLVVVPDARGAVPPQYELAAGRKANGDAYPPLAFPPLAAGMLCAPRGVAAFLRHLVLAYNDERGSGGISHDTAVRMLHARRQAAQQARQFMGVDAGLGIFVAECGANRVAVHQAANEGYRGLFAVVFSGPDTGKGFVAVALGDDAAVPFNAAVGRAWLADAQLEGARLDRLPPIGGGGDEAAAAVSRENVVNQGYRQLLFAAFEADAPELQEHAAPVEHAFAAQHDALRGAEALASSNERFGRASNLVQTREPTFDPDSFGRHGKIVDSWETVRHNPLPSDVAVFRLRDDVGARALDLIEVSTQFHDGNHATAVAVDASESESGDADWRPLLARSPLDGHSVHRFVGAEREPRRYRRVRVHVFPDGGLTRLRLFDSRTAPPALRAQFPSAPARDPRAMLPPTHVRPGATAAAAAEQFSVADVERHWQAALRHTPRAEIDVARDVFGARVEEASNEHYGKASHVVSWRAPRGMWDGFESARARAAGHSEWVRVALGRPTRVERVRIDFKYFVNNNPARIAVDGFDAATNSWHVLVPSTACKAYAGNVANFASVNRKVRVSKVRVSCTPCGGFNRLGVFGQE